MPIRSRDPQPKPSGEGWAPANDSSELSEMWRFDMRCRPSWKEVCFGQISHEQDQPVTGRGTEGEIFYFFRAATAEDVHRCLDEGAKDAEGETALHRGAAYGSAATIGLLITNGGDLDAEDTHRRTPLIIAAENDRKEAMNALVEGGADSTAHFVKAAVNGRPFAMRYLREIGADPQARLHQGRTPLHEASAAAEKGDLAGVKALLEEGASLTAKNAALGIAAYGDDPNVVEALLAAGADVHARSGSGATPLHNASAFANIETMRMLIEAGADPSAKNKYGYSPMYGPVTRGYEEAIRLLVEAGADPEAKVGGAAGFRREKRMAAYQFPGGSYLYALGGDSFR